MPKVQIDGKFFEVPSHQNFLEVCLSLGFNLPYFCWHPALGSVGACRQCAVKLYRDEKDTHGKLVMACMTPVSDGARISITDSESQEFRASIIEWLMTNHPHDCPICDEGGECHLQDMTVMTGHIYRRYRFKKRTFTNQNLGPFVNHEMNRCISCYRCVRFYRDYAGGHDLNVFSAHDHVYFGRHEDGRLESEFSGNLVEVCPTGVFTDKIFKSHFARKWDLQTAPSICPHCSMGCNIIPGERYGTLRRIRNRYHSEINGHFICDRGRFGFEFVNSDRRIRDLWFRGERKAPESLPGILKDFFGSSPTHSKVIGIGSPRASLESNFALRTLVGEKRFFSGLSSVEFELVQTAIKILEKGPVPCATVQDVEKADAIFILGEDISNTAPRLALAAKQSAKNYPLFIALPYQSTLNEFATLSTFLPPDEIARLGHAIAHAIDSRFPAVPHLSPEMTQTTHLIAPILAKAKNPVIISGTGLRSPSLLEASANLAWALCKSAKICLMSSESNSFGMNLLKGLPLSQAFSEMKNGQIDTVILLENNLFRRAEQELVKTFLTSAKQVLVIDSIATAMMPRADLILPATTFAESTGTFINYETRAQRFFSVLSPQRSVKTSSAKESWRWLHECLLAAKVRSSRPWSSIEDLQEEMTQVFPSLKPILEAAPSIYFRMAGKKIARESHRSSGRTATLANREVNSAPPPQDLDSPLSFSMEGYQGKPPAALTLRYWAPGWNSVQALYRSQGEENQAPGKRVIQPFKGPFLLQNLIFKRVPPPFSQPPGQWLAIPIYHLFGSEELSSLSPGIAESSPLPYLAIHPQDANRLTIYEGETIHLTIQSQRPISLPAKLNRSLPQGVVGLPVGLLPYELTGGFTDSLTDVDLPTPCEISKTPLAGAA